MDVLFLITGFVCASIIPFLNLNFLGAKGTLYFFIMTIFVIFTLSYVILSAYKFYIARIDYLKNNTIVSWNIQENKKRKFRFPYYLSLISAIILGVILAVNSVPLISNILISLAFAFVCLGWFLMGIKRLNAKIDSTDNFVLSHMGIIYNNKATVFNGYSKGILNVKKEDNNLFITILESKKEKQISLAIPEDKIADVDAFLIDLKEYFDNANNEE